MTSTTEPQDPEQPASVGISSWWRIVPKRNAEDLYRRRFDTCEEAQQTLAIMRRRRTHKVVAYDDCGKRLTP